MEILLIPKKKAVNKNTDTISHKTDPQFQKKNANRCLPLVSLPHSFLQKKLVKGGIVHIKEKKRWDSINHTTNQVIH